MSSRIRRIGRTGFIINAVTITVLAAVTHAVQAEAYDAAPSVDGLQKRAHILAEKVLCRQPERYIGWPDIDLTHDGEMLVVFSGDRDWHVCPWGKIQMVRSSDGGKTWSEASTIIDTPMDDRDTSIAVLPDGSLLATYHGSLAFAERTGPRYDPYIEYSATIGDDVRQAFKGFWAATSTDDGVTWSDPVKVPAMTPHGPTVLNDGQLMMVSGGKAYRSGDGGQTWTMTGTVPKNPETWKSRYAFTSETTCIQADDGRIIALSRYRDGSDIDLRQTVSTDGGKTWSEPVATGMPGYPAHLLKLNNGWLLASYGRRIEPMGQRACISKDGGRTWLVDEEIILSLAAPQGGGDLGYPASAQLPDGTIWTVYYQVEKHEQGEFPSLMATHWRLRGE